MKSAGADAGAGKQEHIRKYARTGHKWGSEVYNNGSFSKLTPVWFVLDHLNEINNPNYVTPAKLFI